MRTRGLGEHGGERALDERHHAHEVASLLARDPEVVDVEDRHVGAAALQQLQRVGRRARLADLELDALGGVEAALRGDVDPRVDGVRREVEQQRRRLVRAVLAAWFRRSRRGPATRRGGASAPVQRTMGRVRRRVTFSRNLTLSLSRTCQCYCKYCAFATHQPHLHEPAEVEKILDGAVKRNVKELLVLTGEAPDHHPGRRGEARRARARRLHRLRRLGLRARARARAAAAHEPRRAQPRGPRPPARGHRLAGADARVGQPRPRRPPGLADQAPGAAARVHPHRGRAEDPVHERDPRRHRRDRGRARRRARGARRRARRARPPAGGDPPELRPAPELLRAGAGRDRRGGLEGVLAHRPRRRPAARPPDVVDAGRHRGHEAPDRRGAAAAARRRRSRSRRTSPTGGPSSSRRARPTSAA